MPFAPIVIFAYNRPQHLLRALESLSQNSEAHQSNVYIFCDGARSEKDSSQVEQVRLVAKDIATKNWFQSVEVIERSENWGLAKSIITGVTDIVTRYGRVIVLEDDLVFSPYFLKFMNDGLNFYERDERVCSVHGYSYAFPEPMDKNYFLRGGDCWGWATWQRAWQEFNPNGQELLSELLNKQLVYEFDLLGGYPFSRMLQGQIEGKNNSWAIRWRASTFLKGRLTLYPAHSLVANLGFDGSGTHCDDEESIFKIALWDKPVLFGQESVRETLEAVLKLSDLYLKNESIRFRLPAQLKRWLFLLKKQK